MMETMGSRKARRRRSFTKAFKAEVVELVAHPPHNNAELTRRQPPRDIDQVRLQPLQRLRPFRRARLGQHSRMIRSDLPRQHRLRRAAPRDIRHDSASTPAGDSVSSVNAPARSDTCTACSRPASSRSIRRRSLGRSSSCSDAMTLSIARSRSSSPPRRIEHVFDSTSSAPALQGKISGDAPMLVRRVVGSRSLL